MVCFGWASGVQLLPRVQSSGPMSGRNAWLGIMWPCASVNASYMGLHCCVEMYRLVQKCTDSVFAECSVAAAVLKHIVTRESYVWTEVCA